MNTETLASKIQTITTKYLLYILGAAILALGSFQTGVLVGQHQAGFSYRMGDNYYRALGHEHGPFGLPFEEQFGEAHGAAGKVLSLVLPQIVIDEHGTEKTIRLTDASLIRVLRGVGSTTDIHTGDFVVVLGEPNSEGVLEAKLIRILPPPPGSATSTTK